MNINCANLTKKDSYRHLLPKLLEINFRNSDWKCEDGAIIACTRRFGLDG